MKKYPKYKDSGVSWIGEIPEGWNHIPFKVLFRNRKGLAITKANLVDEGLPVISYGQIHSKINNGTQLQQALYRFVDKSYLEDNQNCLVNQGDFIFADTSEDLEGIGNCVYINEEMTLFAGYHTIIAKSYSTYENKYLAYLFKTDIWRSQLRSRVSGIKVYSLTQQILFSSKVIMPPMAEQAAIVSYLDKKTCQIDRFISEAEKEIEKLNELKQAQIARMVTHGLNPNAPMKDSGIAWIGQIPEHWEVKRIALLFSENKDKNYDYEFDHALKFNYGTLVPKNEKGDVSELKDTYIAYTKIKRNDIAINCLNLNYDFVSQRVAECPQDGILTSAYLIITPREGVNSQYYNFLFKAMDSKKLFHGMGTGIRLTLSYNELKKQYVVVPPNDEQAAIVSAINSMGEKIDTLTTKLIAQIGYLKELKQRIISDAVTGKIKC